MGTTRIEWATKSWNPISGCTKISEGCQHCYAERMSKRLAGRYGYPKDEPFRVTFHPDKIDEPYSWHKPQKVFVCSMSDLFHNDVPFEKIARIWSTMFGCGAVNSGPQHTFMILTKRPKRMAEFCNWMHDVEIRETAYRNIYLGVTTENQRTADERIPILLQIPSIKHFVSVEPMLEQVELKKYFYTYTCGLSPCICKGLALDWVICGGETGPKARTCNYTWVYDLAKQCTSAGVPFFDKRDVLGGKQEWPLAVK